MYIGSSLRIISYYIISIGELFEYEAWKRKCKEMFSGLWRKEIKGGEFETRCCIGIMKCMVEIEWTRERK